MAGKTKGHPVGSAVVNRDGEELMEDTKESQIDKALVYLGKSLR